MQRDIGARRDGHGIADFADMTILSFHPVKHITTGEGGMVLTNNKDYFEKLIMFRNHGITKEPSKFSNRPDGDWYYEMQELGYNYRITDIQCALGISQIKKLDKFLYRRNQIAKVYEEELKDIDWITAPPRFNKSWLNKSEYDNLSDKPNDLHSYHLFPILLNEKINRKKLFEYLRGNGIGVQVHYIPVIDQKYYKQNCEEIVQANNAEFLYRQILSLPMYYKLDDFSIKKITSIIHKFRG